MAFVSCTEALGLSTIQITVKNGISKGILTETSLDVNTYTIAVYRGSNTNAIASLKDIPAMEGGAKFTVPAGSYRMTVDAFNKQGTKIG